MPPSHSTPLSKYPFGAILLCLGILAVIVTQVFALLSDRSLYADGSTLLMTHINWILIPKIGLRFLGDLFFVPGWMVMKMNREWLSPLGLVRLHHFSCLLGYVFSLYLCFHFWRQKRDCLSPLFPLLSFATASMLTIINTTNAVCEMTTLLWPALFGVTFGDMRSRRSGTLTALCILALGLSHEGALLLLPLIPLAIFLRFRRALPGPLPLPAWAFLGLSILAVLGCLIRTRLAAYTTTGFFSDWKLMLELFAADAGLRWFIYAIGLFGILQVRIFGPGKSKYLLLIPCFFLGYPSTGLAAPYDERILAPWLAGIIGLGFLIQVHFASSAPESRRRLREVLSFVVALTLFAASVRDYHLTRSWLEGRSQLMGLLSQASRTCIEVRIDTYNQLLPKWGFFRKTLLHLSVLFQDSKSIRNVVVMEGEQNPCSRYDRGSPDRNGKWHAIGEMPFPSLGKNSYLDFDSYHSP